MKKNFWKFTVPPSDHYFEKDENGVMREYYTNYNRTYYTKDKNAAEYIKRVTKDIEDSRAARGAK